MIPRLMTVPVVGLVLAGSVLGATIASASTDTSTDTSNVPPASEQGASVGSPNLQANALTKEQRQALRVALKNCDYQAWLKLVGDKPIAKKINESNFPRLCEADRLMHQGKFKEARAIFKELGIKPPFFRHHKHHKRHHPRGPKPGQQQGQQPIPQSPDPQPQQ